MSYAITLEIWEEIDSFIQPGMKTLEFGSGFSTVLFSNKNVKHTAIESHKHWYIKTQEHLKQCGNLLNVELLLCPLIKGWYSWEPETVYDLILIDGPRGVFGREGVFKYIEKMIHESSIIFVDDVHRKNELRLAEMITKKLDKKLTFFDRIGIIGG